MLLHVTFSHKAKAVSLPQQVTDEDVSLVLLHALAETSGMSRMALNPQVPCRPLVFVVQGKLGLETHV